MKLSRAVSEFMRGYFGARGRVKKTEEAYRIDLLQFRDYAGSDLNLSSLSSKVVWRWVEHLRGEDYAPASVRRKMAALRVFCSYWVRKGVMSESPFWRMELKFEQVERMPRVMTEREMRKLLSQARRDHLAAELKGDAGQQSAGAYYRALRDLVLVEVLYATGMRVGEVSGLDVGDLVVEDSAFRVSGSGGRDRLVYILGDSALPVLLDYLKVREMHESESSAFFLNSYGERLSVQGIANAIDRLCLLARLGRRVTPGMFRNAMERLLLSKRVDLRVVTVFLGRSSIPARRGVPRLTGDHVVGELRKVHPSLGF